MPGWGGGGGMRAGGFGRMAVATAAVIGIGVVGGIRLTTDGGSEPSSEFWAGTFDCYGADAACFDSNACTTTTSNNAAGAVATLITNAAAGATICLDADGSPYPSITSTVDKASDVTIQPVDGEAVTVGHLSLTGTSHLVFQGFTVAGANVWGAEDTTIKHATMTAGILACTSTTCGNGVVADAGVLIDHLRMDAMQGAEGNEGRITVRGQDGNKTASGVVISNSLFNGSNPPDNCSDGVQVIGTATAVQIGPGNEFTDLPELTCLAHVDPLQGYGSSQTLIVGNWFHDSGDGTGGPMFFNGGDREQAVGNVFEGTYACALCFNYFDDTGEIHHNVFVNSSPSIGASPAIVTNNVFLDTPPIQIGDDPGTLEDENHNICVSSHATCDDATDIYDDPVFEGGANPATFDSYYDFVLAATSPGYGDGTGGTNIGIDPSVMP